MNVPCTIRLIVIALFLLCLTGCGGGGGDGGGDGEGDRPSTMPEPEYDLTGVWEVTEPIDCVAGGGGLSDIENQTIGLYVETDLLLGLETRLVQMGNEFEVTNLSTGSRVSGTISDDQVLFPYSEQAILEIYDVDYYGEYEGTVLNANLIDMRLEGPVILEAIDGEMFGVLVICTFDFTRTS